jgi:hypothetical protein
MFTICEHRENNEHTVEIEMGRFITPALIISPVVAKFLESPGADMFS